MDRDRVRRVLERGLEARVGPLQFLLAGLPLAGVAADVRDADHLAVGVGHPGPAELVGEALAVLRDQRRLGERRLAGLDDGPDGARDEPGVRVGDELQRLHLRYLRVAVARHLPEPAGPLPEPDLDVEEVEHVRLGLDELLGQRALFLEFRLVGRPFGDVPDDAAEQAPVLVVVFREADQARHLVAVGVQRRQFDAAPVDVSLAGREVLLEAVDVVLPESLRDQRQYRLPDEGVGVVAEDVLDGGVGEDHLAVLAYRQDALRGGLHGRPVARLGVGPRLSGHRRPGSRRLPSGANRFRAT